jgi:pimeloyl-ACP methyl ester carboxylesterase
VSARLVAVWLVLLVPLAAPPAEEAEDQVMHALPADPEAVVIRWHSAGGQAAQAAGPDLEVRADGTVTVGSRLTGGRPVEGRISPERLQELLRFALDDNDFFAVAPGQLERQIAASQRARAEAGSAGGAVAVPTGPPYLDAGTTVLTIAADGRRHEVRQQGLFAAAREHPEIPALAQLRAIELRLLDLAQEIAAAGR